MTATFATPLTALFGIRHPILCGGLMWLADARYVAAVVGAGGMGFITARTFPEPARFRDELRLCRELTGGAPFGVNLYISARSGDNGVIDSHVGVLLEEGVRHVETSGMSPTPWLPRLKEAGCVVIHKVSQVRHGLSAARAGVDAVSVVGAECGGHPGLQLIGTMVQGALAPPQFDVPLALGGGIGTGGQLVAALAMGAAGVVLGTRMLVASEIWAKDAYKERIAQAGEGDTRLVLASMKNTYRVLDNATARRVAELEAAGVLDFEEYRPWVRGGYQREAYESGDPDKGVLSMGQAAAFAREVKPVAAIFAEILAEAEAALARLDRWRAPGAAAAE